MLTRAVLGPPSSLSSARRRVAWFAAGALTLSALLGPAIGSAFAASVTPTPTESDNITTCPYEGYATIGIDGNDSSGSAGGVTVDVTYNGDNSLDFEATGGLVYVAFVKGGNNYNEYDYRPDGVASDTDLVSPLNGGGQVPAVSHSVFCVKKTTTTTTTTQTTSTTETTSSTESSVTTSTTTTGTESSVSTSTTTTGTESSVSTSTTTTGTESGVSTSTSTTSSGQELPATGSAKPTLPSTSTVDGEDGGSAGGPLALVLILLGAGAAGLVVLSPVSTRIRK